MIGLDKRASQAEIAGDRTALDQGLALPRSAPGLVVAQGRVERTGQRTLFAVGAKPHVNPVGNAPRGVFGEQPDDLGSHPCEELGVRDDSRPRGAAILVIEEDKIDVGAVVQLGAAELAQAQDDEPGGAAIGPQRGPEPGLGPPPRQPRRGFGAGVGKVRQVERDHLQGEAADDVVVADAQSLPKPEAANGQCLIVPRWTPRSASSRGLRSGPLGRAARPRPEASRAAPGRGSGPRSSTGWC